MKITLQRAIQNSSTPNWPKDQKGSVSNDTINRYITVALPNGCWGIRLSWKNRPGWKKNHPGTKFQVQLLVFHMTSWFFIRGKTKILIPKSLVNPPLLLNLPRVSWIETINPWRLEDSPRTTLQLKLKNPHFFLVILYYVILDKKNLSTWIQAISPGFCPP